MRMRLKIVLLLITITLASVYYGCSKDPSLESKKGSYKTKNVLVVVVDGARYSETWGLAFRPFISHRSQLLEKGVLCNRFYNNGYCFTNAGHAAVTTGIYQNINNGGLEYPQKPSFFQYWLKTSGRPSSEAWVVTTKDKLEILTDCVDSSWQGLYRPNSDCGNSGLGSGYREDSTTFNHAKFLFSAYHPRLMLINFKEPDASAHAGDSAAYLQGIIDTDNYIYRLWQFLQADTFYSGSTTLIVTNDHGRHTAGHLDGFISHADTCDGCRHIEFFGIGPDFKQNFTCNEPHDQIDIPGTIAELMGFQMPGTNGKVIKDIFK